MGMKPPPSDWHSPVFNVANTTSQVSRQRMKRLSRWRRTAGQMVTTGLAVIVLRKPGTTGRQSTCLVSNSRVADDSRCMSGGAAERLQ